LPAQQGIVQSLADERASKGTSTVKSASDKAIANAACMGDACLSSKLCKRERTLLKLFSYSCRKIWTDAHGLCHRARSLCKRMDATNQLKPTV
jgi:hypothetical protein